MRLKWLELLLNCVHFFFLQKGECYTVIRYLKLPLTG